MQEKVVNEKYMPLYKQEDKLFIVRENDEDHTVRWY